MGHFQTLSTQGFRILLIHNAIQWRGTYVTYVSRRHILRTKPLFSFSILVLKFTHEKRLYTRDAFIYFKLNLIAKPSKWYRIELIYIKGKCLNWRELWHKNIAELENSYFLVASKVVNKTLEAWSNREDAIQIKKNVALSLH